MVAMKENQCSFTTNFVKVSIDVAVLEAEDEWASCFQRTGWNFWNYDEKISGKDIILGLTAIYL